MAKKANTHESVLKNYHRLSVEQVRQLIEQIGATELVYKDFDAELLQYFDHIVFVCAVNDKIRVTYRLHFLNEHALEFWSITQKKSKQVATRGRVIDGIKEFCNQFTGRVRNVLNVHQIELGQSLPIYVSGFNELFFSNLFEVTHSHSTKIIFSEVEFVLSTTIEFMNDAILDTLAKVPYDFKDSNTNDVELF